METLVSTDFQHEHGTETSQADVDKLMPKKVKRRRKIQTEDGTDAGWEEYYDYIFPDDAQAQPNLKLLAMAKQWKQMAEDEDEESEESEEDEEDEAGEKEKETHEPKTYAELDKDDSSSESESESEDES